jgi:ClpP class serine protease
MHPVRLISAILKGKWYIDPDFALAQGPVVAGLINNQTALYPIGIKEETEDLPAIAASIVAAEGGVIYGVRHSYRHGFDMALPGSVAVIDIKDALMKEDQDCGPDGTETIGRIIKKADNHSNIIAIVLNIDSPGGTVDGTEALAAIIKGATKPVVTFVNGLGTSAREIIASTDTDEVGSVGVILNFADMRPVYEKQGVVFHTVLASTSPDKQKTFNDLRAGKYDEIIKEQLDVLDEKFMNAVRENRPMVEDHHLTGKVFFARDVMGVFVDAIGTIETAIVRAAELAEINSASGLPPSDPRPEKDSNKSIQNIYSMNQFALLNAVLGVATLESVDEVVSLNEEQLAEIEGALDQTNLVVAERDTAFGERDAATAARDLAVTEREAAVADAETAVAERTTAQNELAAAIALFDAIDGTVAAAEGHEAKAAAVRALLAAKPGAKIEGNLETEDPEAGAPVDADWETINALPHNQDVDKNF